MFLTTHGRDLQHLLGLKLPPVAIAFRDSAPPGLRRIESPAPAGCGYWRLAADGAVFYTEASDHYTCPVGAHTHGVELPPAVADELNGLVNTMVHLQYIKIEEIPKIPRRQTPFRVALYARVVDASFEPDVVLVRGTAKQLMMAAEAAQAVGVASGGATLGRPTCAILPESLRSGLATASFGCIGNRVYTGAGDDELYVTVRGRDVARVADEIDTIAKANTALAEYHRGRRATLATE